MRNTLLVCCALELAALQSNFTTMKTKLISSLFIAAAAVTGAFANTSSASAFTWNESWTQPTIIKGFNHQPYQQYVQQERIELPGTSQIKVDLNNLKIRKNHEVKAYFINEGAGFQNQLAFESKGATNSSGLLFQNISSTESVLKNNDGPLKLGDGVSLGMIKGGSQLNFFLRSDGNRIADKSKANIYTTDDDANPDGLQHAIGYLFENRYVLLGWEDLYGDLNATGGKNQKSDRDFNDAVFVIDIGDGNLADVPEPSVVLSLVGLGAAGLLRRRQKGNAAE
jgi:hypothetical protein